MTYTVCSFFESKSVKFLEKYLGLNEFLPSDKIMKFLARDCDWALPKVVCEDVVFLLCGFDREQISDETLQHIVSHDPAGTSTKTVLHYLQEIHNNGNFQNFDYGPEGNMIKYKQKTPPTYRLKNIRVPTYLMYADNDYLASPTDVKRLSLNLTANIGLYEVPLPNFNHIDFLWGKDAPQLIFKPLLGVLRNSTI